ncbi:MAG: nonstructural protein [Microvirus sp.]|nr:MAG: nonstructural protein [Microvirus sp.]
MNEIFAIYDHKAELYMEFFKERNKATAIRAVMAAMEDVNHPIRKNATDYSLFHIATWDPELGTFTKAQETGNKHVTDCWILRAKIENDQKIEGEE